MHLFPDRNYRFPEPEDSEILTLYKYMTETALVCFLSNGCLKLSFGYDSNDPFELLPAEEKPDSKEFVHTGFVSFTKNDNSPEMWGIYADKYRGARLEFQFPYCKNTGHEYDGNYAHFLGIKSRIEDGNQIEFIRRWSSPQVGHYDHYGDAGDIIYKCRYSTERPPSMTRNLSAASHDDYKNWIRKRITTKHISWEHEDEYRLVYLCSCCDKILPNGNSFIYLLNELTPFLKSITLGPRSNITLSDVAHNLGQNNILAPGQSIAYRKARFQEGLYDLDMDSQTLTFPPKKRTE